MWVLRYKSPNQNSKLEQSKSIIYYVKTIVQDLKVSKTTNSKVISKTDFCNFNNGFTN